MRVVEALERLHTALQECEAGVARHHLQYALEGVQEVASWLAFEPGQDSRSQLVLRALARCGNVEEALLLKEGLFGLLSKQLGARVSEQALFKALVEARRILGE